MVSVVYGITGGIFVGIISCIANYTRRIDLFVVSGKTFGFVSVSKVETMPTIAEIEKNPSEWAKQYTQDGRLVYVNKITGKKVSRKPSVQERALEIATRLDHSSAPPPSQKDDVEGHLRSTKTGTNEDIYLQQFTIDRTPFFMHLYSGEVMWFLPRETPQSAVKFITHVNEKGVPYYENLEKKTTSWTLPLEKMSSLARKNASTFRKYSRSQVEEKLHISYEDAMRESYLPTTSKKGSGGLHDAVDSKTKKTPDKKQQKYYNIASTDFNHAILAEKTAKANQPSTGQGLFGSGQERGKPLVRIVFERYDKNKDGFIDSRELQDLCYDFGYFLYENELRSAIDRFDTSNTGSLNYIDFMVWWRNTESFSQLKISDGEVRQRSAAAEIFKRYDDKRIGYITRQQFRPLHAELVAAGLTLQTIDKCISELDTNNDGIIQFNEFIAWLDKSRAEWEGSSKNVARKLSTFKTSAPTLKKLFGDLMTSTGDSPEKDSNQLVMAKDHPDYAKYFRIINVGGDIQDVMVEMKEQGLDVSLLQTPQLMISINHIGDNSSSVSKLKEEKFTDLFKKTPKKDVVAQDVPVPSSPGLFSFDPSTYIYTSISKPLGLSLNENVPDCAMGVYIESLAPGGKAEATGILYPGLVLVTACGIDVQTFDFDSVMELLRNASADVPLDLVFADPTTAVLHGQDNSYSTEEYPVQATDLETNEEQIDEPDANKRASLPKENKSHLSPLESFISVDPFADEADEETDMNKIRKDENNDNNVQDDRSVDRMKMSFSSKGAAAAVLKSTARRKAQSAVTQNESDEFSDVTTPNRTAAVGQSSGFGSVFGLPSNSSMDNLFKPADSDGKPQTVTRVSSLRRGRSDLLKAMSTEEACVEPLPTSYTSNNIPRPLLTQESSLDVEQIMGRAKAPPKRAPSDIREDAAVKLIVNVPTTSAQRMGFKLPSPPPPPKPSADLLSPMKNSEESMIRDPIQSSKNKPSTPSPTKSPLSPYSHENPMLNRSEKSHLSPLSKPMPQESVRQLAPVPPPPPVMVFIEEQSDFNLVSKKPMSVFNMNNAVATPSPMIDPYLREKYGGVPLASPDPINDSTFDLVNLPERNVDAIAIGTQTDYSAFMDADYQTSYQLLLGEKAEVQAILARVRAEELATNARIQRAEDESFRRCQEREQYLSEMLALEEQKAMERISVEEDRLVEKHAELETAWQRLRDAETIAKEYYNQRMNDLIYLATGLAQHQKKLLDDKKKVGKQRLTLDLAMRDINNYTHFTPFVQANGGNSSPTSRSNYNAPLAVNRNSLTPVQKHAPPPPLPFRSPDYVNEQNNNRLRQSPLPAKALLSPAALTPQSRSKSITRPPGSASRQIDYRNL